MSVFYQEETHLQRQYFRPSRVWRPSLPWSLQWWQKIGRVGISIKYFSTSKIVDISMIIYDHILLDSAIFVLLLNSRLFPEDSWHSLHQTGVKRWHSVAPGDSWSERLGRCLGTTGWSWNRKEWIFARVFFIVPFEPFFWGRGNCSGSTGDEGTPHGICFMIAVLMRVKHSSWIHLWKIHVSKVSQKSQFHPYLSPFSYMYY